MNGCSPFNTSWRPVIVTATSYQATARGIEKMAGILPDLASARQFSASIRAGLNLCYTCGSCAAECPVNRATNLLHPHKYVRLAGFGVFDEFLASPEIWYCIACNRCSSICPMTVKPAALLASLRDEALRRGFVSARARAGVKEMQLHLHRVRLRLTDSCKNAGPAGDAKLEWAEQAGEPASARAHELDAINGSAAGTRDFRKSFGDYLGLLTNVNSCVTCCECTNACPVFREKGLLDPMRVFRTIVFGLREELLSSPSIWLCLNCESCTNACPQRVKGHLVFRRARELALQGGFVDSRFLDRWQKAQKLAYREYVRRVGELLGNGL
jgi:heterodisulfide reductase subunit C